MTKDDGSTLNYEGARFCGHCGTTVTREHSTGPLEGQLLVNARAVWGFNPFKLGGV